MTKQRSIGPKRYLYLLCEDTKTNVPMFTDGVAGGYRLKHIHNTPEEAQELIDNLKASKYGKHIVRAYVKKGTWYGWYQSYVVVKPYKRRK